MKEEAILRALVGSHEELSVMQRMVLLVQAAFLANGFVSDSIRAGQSSGEIALYSPDWLNSADEVFASKFIGGCEVKCVSLGSSRIAVHATNNENQVFSVQLDPSDSDAALIDILKNAVVRPLQGKEPVGSQPQQHRAYVLQDTPPGPAGGPGRFQPPHAPPFGTPMGPGELVGPNHPIFTGEPEGAHSRAGLRDPRYDPLGPGFIGEPNRDDFPPPPFGEPPGGRRGQGRAPLRGPHANIGPGGMFM